jgi:hypothetical protein
MLESPLDLMRLLLPDKGSYFAASFLPKPIQKSVLSLEDLYNTAAQLNRQGRHAYMALAGFDNSGMRRQANVLWVRSLWLDIDCEKKRAQYATKVEGLEQIKCFIKTSRLPEPVIIDSGWGYHVYWPFTKNILPGQWKKMAKGLKDLTDKLNLRIDPPVTTNEAATLRVPGLLNYGKEDYIGEPRLVTLLSAGEPSDPDVVAAILANKSAINVGSAPPPPAGPGFTLPTYSEENREQDPLKIIQGCRQMIPAGQPRAERFDWFLMLRVLSYCVNGRLVAHKLSQQSPTRYSAEILDEQFDSRAPDGPPLCTTFTNQALCEGCIHKGQIRTPVQLGNSTNKFNPPAAARQPYVGYTYRVVPGLGLYERRRDAMGNVIMQPDGQESLILINQNEFYIQEIQEEQQEGGQRCSVKFYVKHRNDSAEREVLFSMDHLSRQDLIKWMGNNRVLPVRSEFNKAMFDFMSTYIAKLQAERIIQRVSHFGWISYTDSASGKQLPGFVLGKRLYTTDGQKPVALISNRLPRMAEEEYCQCGDLEVWKDIPKLYQELDQPEGQLFVCASFAAPFMRFADGTAKNLVLSIWDSRGGKGKSTLLEVVNSVWGHPRLLSCSKNDTVSARYQILGVRRNLPFCMDELTTISEHDLSTLLFDVVNGREKKKSTTGGTDLARTGQWETITMVTTNRSLHEIMRHQSAQTIAESMRVVEMQCQFENYAGSPIAKRIMHRIQLMEHNYGLAGSYFLTECFKHPEVFRQIPSEAAAFAQDIMREADERFWGYGLGMALAAGRLAVRQGLLTYDMAALESWVRLTLLRQMRAWVRGTLVQGSELLVQFLQAHLDNILVVRCERRPSTMPEPKGVAALNSVDPYVIKRPARELLARIALDERLVYVSRKALDTWIINSRCSIETFLGDLAREGVWNSATGKHYTALGKGVSIYHYGRVSCYAFNGVRLGGELPGIGAASDVLQSSSD